MLQEQKKRGRPELLPKEFYNELQKIYPNVKTKRGLQNKFYAVEALSALKNEDTGLIKFIQDKDSILIQLGRIPHGATIREWAWWIYEQSKIEKKTTHEWADIVKRLRRKLFSEQTLAL